MTLEQLMEQLASAAANDLGNPGVKVPRDVTNPGVYIGFMLGVEAMMTEYKKLQDRVEFLEECNERYDAVVTEIMENN